MINMSGIKLSSNCNECGVHYDARNDVECNEGKPHDFSTEQPHTEKCNHCLIPYKHRGGRYCVPGKRHNFDIDYEPQRPKPEKPKVDKLRFDSYVQAALTGILAQDNRHASQPAFDRAVDMAILTMEAADKALKEINE
nr:PH23-137 [Vibrio phage 1]